MRHLVHFIITDLIQGEPAQDSAAGWDSLRVWGPKTNADNCDHALARSDEDGLPGEAHHQASHAAADAAATALRPLSVGGACQGLDIHGTPNVYHCRSLVNLY